MLTDCVCVCVCLCITEYHKTLKRLSLEVSFLRHLSEMHRIGLVDSDDVFNCILLLRELEEAKDDRPEPRFIYAEEALRRAEKAKQQKQHKQKTENTESKDKKEKVEEVLSPTQSATKN